jgi:hypothetical protein
MASAMPKEWQIFRAKNLAILIRTGKPPESPVPNRIPFRNSCSVKNLAISLCARINSLLTIVHFES